LTFLNKCKSCTRNVVIKKQELEKIKSMKTDYSLNLIASEEVWTKRKGICMECPSLLYGTTCAYSGGIIEYKTRFLNKGCPDPSGAKW
jgi:hypothetical protein